MMQFYLCTQRTKQCHHIGKTISAPDTAAQRRYISKLHTDDMSDALCHGAMCIRIQCFICLELPQRYICTDPKLCLILLDLIQSQITQVDRCPTGLIHHLQPQHPAQNNITLFLVQLICLLDALCPHILVIIKHRTSLFRLFSACFPIISTRAACAVNTAQNNSSS